MSEGRAQPSHADNFRSVNFVLAIQADYYEILPVGVFNVQVIFDQIVNCVRIYPSLSAYRLRTDTRQELAWRVSQ